MAHTRLFEAEFSSPTVVMLCHMPGSLCSDHKTRLLFPKFIILQEKKLTLDAVNIKGKGEASLNYKICNMVSEALKSSVFNLTL